MSDLISRKAVITAIHNYFKDLIDRGVYSVEAVDCSAILSKYIIGDIPTAYDAEYELRLLKNYLYHKPKTYRQRNQNFVVVRDLLMSGTSHAGMTSCVMKCHELGIDPYGYELKGAVDK